MGNHSQVNLPEPPSFPLSPEHTFIRGIACGSSLLCDAKCVPFKILVRHSHKSCLIRTRRGLIPRHVPSLRYPSHSDEQPLDPRTAGRSGRLVIQSPRTGYEPNTTVEISSTEVTLVHLPSKRTSFCSVFNSGEDATTTPVSGEVDERQSTGMLDSPLLMQKREASAVPVRIYHSTEESSVSSSPHIRSAVRPVAIYSHKKKSGRDPRSVQETHSASERIRTEHQEVRYHLQLCAHEAAEREKTALARLSEAEFHTRLLLEERRNQLRSGARSEVNVQELGAESADKASAM